MNLELRKFDMKTISFKPNESKGPVVVLIGRRDTGKSFLVRDLLFYHQDIPIGVVIAGTEEGNGFYGKLVPKLFIHNEYNTAIIENILKRQKSVLKQIKKEMETFKRTTIDPRAFVILDDCLYDGTWARDKMMKLLFIQRWFLFQKMHQSSHASFHSGMAWIFQQIPSQGCLVIPFFGLCEFIHHKNKFGSGMGKHISIKQT